MPTEVTPSSSGLTLATYDSPIGHLILAARGDSLTSVWVTGQCFPGRLYDTNKVITLSSVNPTSPDSRDSVYAGVEWDEADACVSRVTALRLDDYFTGEAPPLAAIHLAPAGTGF